MRDEVNRLLGLEGFEVSAVEERGGGLEIEVELSIATAMCAHCGRGTVEVKERPVVWVRDLAIKRPVVVVALAQAPIRLSGVRADVHGDPSGDSATPADDGRAFGAMFALARNGAAHAEIARNEYRLLRGFMASARSPSTLGCRSRRLRSSQPRMSCPVCWLADRRGASARRDETPRLGALVARASASPALGLLGGGHPRGPRGS